MTTANKVNGAKGVGIKNGSAKAAHVNMMTDTIIANLPAEGLRAVMRGLLGTDESFTMTSNFHTLAARYLEATRPEAVPALFENSPRPTSALYALQSRYRCLMGCGFGFESIEALTAVVRQTEDLRWDERTIDGQCMMDTLAIIDGDAVQAVTAVQKELLTTAGLRPMSDSEKSILDDFRSALLSGREKALKKGQEFAFERGLSRLQKLEGSSPIPISLREAPTNQAFSPSKSALETFQLGNAVIPRMFMGLWQFSSPAWGTASRSKINCHFRKHVDAGFTSYGMYGVLPLLFCRAFNSSFKTGNGRMHDQDKLSLSMF
jgi:hypothetical protein